MWSLCVDTLVCYTNGGNGNLDLSLVVVAKCNVFLTTWLGWEGGSITPFIVVFFFLKNVGCGFSSLDSFVDIKTSLILQQSPGGSCLGDTLIDRYGFYSSITVPIKLHCPMH